MHEMSIVEGILNGVRQELLSHPGAPVQTVRVRVGALRLVIPETLQFCYTAATQNTPLAGSRLEVESVSARARCRQCRAEFAVEDNWFQCPHCNEADGELLTGNELNLTGIEITEPCPA
jgi:hydrogenase nickel incorporation protein HypA/HybF